MRPRTAPSTEGLAFPKPGAKRKAEEGQQVPGSTLRTYRPLQSRTPLKAGAPNPEIDGPQSEACRMLPCAICAAPPPSQPHHDPKRSLGGLDKDTGPLCATHHAESETMPLSKFRAKYGLNWSDVVDAVREWMNAGYPQGGTPW